MGGTCSSLEREGAIRRARSQTWGQQHPSLLHQAEIKKTPRYGFSALGAHWLPVAKEEAWAVGWRSDLASFTQGIELWSERDMK